MAVSFEQLEDKLSSCDTTMRAAEAHGMLSGVMCSGSQADGGASWLNELLEGKDRNNLLIREMAGMLEELVKQTLQGFEDDNFEFALLLPDDQEPLARRMLALAEWCQGFYMGLALAGVTDIESLPENSREFVQDIMDIAQLEIDENSGEEEEAAYTEVLEYVRVGVLLVREELRVAPG